MVAFKDSLYHILELADCPQDCDHVMFTATTEEQKKIILAQFIISYRSHYASFVYNRWIKTANVSWYHEYLNMLSFLGKKNSLDPAIRYYSSCHLRKITNAFNKSLKELWLMEKELNDLSASDIEELYEIEQAFLKNKQELEQLLCDSFIRSLFMVTYNTHKLSEYAKHMWMFFLLTSCISQDEIKKFNMDVFIADNKEHEMTMKLCDNMDELIEFGDFELTETIRNDF
jgi:hypothetical protein